MEYTVATWLRTVLGASFKRAAISLSARPSQISSSTSRSLAVKSVKATLGSCGDLTCFTLASFSISIRLNQEASFITSSMADSISSSVCLRSVMSINTSR
ncbi:hypothetical protein D3C72_2064510 [compost metagenome]